MHEDSRQGSVLYWFVEFSTGRLTVCLLSCTLQVLDAVRRHDPAAADAKGLNEMWLIHGTSKTNPDEICKERGIDFHYAEAGYFGRATYFSEFTSYSHSSYRYDVPGQPGVAQLLLVRVAAGLVQVRRRLCSGGNVCE